MKRIAFSRRSQIGAEQRRDPTFYPRRGSGGMLVLAEKAAVLLLRRARLVPSVVLRSTPFVLAVPCALMAPLFVLSIPGDPATTSRQWAYWLALWSSLVIYPVAVGIHGARLWWSRGTVRMRGLWRQLWIVFGLQIALWSPIVVLFGQEELRRAEIRANMPIEQKLQYAIWHGRPEEARSIVEAGGDVNMRLFNGGTAGQFATEKSDWDLVIWLLKRGAHIDHPDRMGHSLRKAVAEAPPETEPGRSAALDAVRAMIADKPGNESSVNVR